MAPSKSFQATRLEFDGQQNLIDSEGYVFLDYDEAMTWATSRAGTIIILVTWRMRALLEVDQVDYYEYKKDQWRSCRTGELYEQE